MENTTFSFDRPTTTSPPDAVKRTVETAGAALHGSIDRVTDPARSSVDRLSSTAHETVDRLASGASHLADQVSDRTRRVTEAPRQALDYSRTWVKDKPFEAVGAALAVGFVAGWLSRR